MSDVIFHMCILWDGLELLAGKRCLTSQPNETVDAFALRVMQASLVADLSEMCGIDV